MKRLANNTDTIFFYSKSDKYNFTTPLGTMDENELLKKYDKVDENGKRYKSEPIELPKMMARKNLIFEYRGYTPEYGWMMVREKLEELDSLNKIYFTKNGKPRRKNFLHDYEGSEIDNIWTDIEPVGHNQSEIIGYPTQKPEALLERIIKASSNEGDVVLDAFVGGGTTVAVADRLNRKWIGIDQSVQAIKVSEARLDKQRGLFQAPFAVKLHKYDYDTLRYKDAFEFERWIVEQFGGEANAKQRGDMGIDGKKNGVPIQVKRSDNIGRDVIDKFPTAMERFYGGHQNLDKRRGDKEIDGYIIAFSFGKGAVEEVARIKNDRGLIIELVKVEDIIPIATKPKLEFTFEDKGVNDKKQRIVEFTAKTQSNIEFYQWDFGYNEEDGFKAEIMIDKEGVQTKGFETGEYNIACKVVDMEGMQSIEVVRFKINGVVKKV
jgi:hypothetical protein